MLKQIIHLALWPVFFIVCWYVINYVLKLFEKKQVENEKELSEKNNN